MTTMTSAEIGNIRSAAKSAMRDSCQIGQRQAPTSNDPGDVSFTWGAEIACGYLPKTKSEMLDNGSQATVTTATIRLPWGTLVSTQDRIRITKQAGVALSPMPQYGIVGAHFGALANFVVEGIALTGGSVL